MCVLSTGKIIDKLSSGKMCVDSLDSQLMLLRPDSLDAQLMLLRPIPKVP